MNNKLVWKSEIEMQKELKKKIESWKKGFSKDGYILSATGKFTYRKIVYLIKVLRYYNHTDKFTNMGNRISDSHVVVEYPKETKPILDLIPSDFETEFLYHDTLHSHNDKQTIEEQIQECHKLAKQDIDNLLDGEISKRIDEGIKILQKVKKKLINSIYGIKKIKWKKTK